jgi:hypothetical protein
VPRKKASKHIEDGDEFRADLIAECYIGFPKLLNDELKAFDIKDSIFLDTMKTHGACTAGGTVTKNDAQNSVKIG